MQQDWSQPFTIDLVRSVKSFCVYCATREDSRALLHMLDKAEVPHFGGWTDTCVCCRFKDGVLESFGRVVTYEDNPAWYILPKYTFYQDCCVDLDDIDVPNSMMVLI